MQIGLLCEGPIDFELVSALLRRISDTRAGIRWPIRISDMILEVRVRTGGYGQVVKALRRLLALLSDGGWLKFTLFVVVIDRKSGSATREIRRLLGGQEKFVFGIAVREIEGWWLADRQNTLQWLRLTEQVRPGLRYWRRSYNPERDDRPKRTLNELTELSEHVDRCYGDGNLELARDFASFWCDGANLDQIEVLCPRGFAPFCRATEQKLQRARRRTR